MSEPAAPVPRRRPFRQYKYRSVELEELLKKKDNELMALVTARIRRRMKRGLSRKHMRLVSKLKKEIKAAHDSEDHAKPKAVKTHLRDMIILPDIVHSVVGIHNGKGYNEVEIKPDMIGHYLGEFSFTYRPVKHGRPGIGATHSSRFIPLK